MATLTLLPFGMVIAAEKVTAGNAILSGLLVGWVIAGAIAFAQGIDHDRAWKAILGAVMVGLVIAQGIHTRGGF